METDDIRSQGRMDHSTIKLNDERLKFMTLIGNPDITYEFATEPDFNYLKVWFMLDHLGARMRDMSGLGNDAFIEGHPTLRRAGLSLGYMQTDAAPATPVMLFNSGTDVVSATNGEYIWILDNPSIRFTTFATGFSLTCRFCCLDFSTHYPNPDNPNSSYARRIAAKSDNATNGWTLLVYPTGTNTGGIEFEIMHNGTGYARLSTGYTAGLWYQIVITYDPNASPRIKIYTAGTENSSSSTFNTAIPTYTNLRIGARTSTTGFFRGYIHDFRLYMDKVLTQTEITNINTNELTIDNIEKGHVFMLQYSTVGLAMPKRSKTHKYNVGGKVISTRRHKYNMGGKAIVTKTHKFSLAGMENPVRTQVIRFQKTTTAANGTVQDVTLNFTPKAIIVWSDGSIVSDTYVDHFHSIYGFSDGTNHACVTAQSQDGQGTSATRRSHRTDSVFAQLNDNADTVKVRGSCSFGTNKVTFVWDVNNSEAIYIHMLAIGGNDITNTKVNTVQIGRSSTGTQNYTGLGFTPVTNESILFTISNQYPSVFTNTTVPYGGAAFGAAVSTTKRLAFATAEADTYGTSGTWRRYENNRVIAEIDQIDGSSLHTADFNGWITDGFQLDWTTTPEGSDYMFSYLVIKGGLWDCGSTVSPASPQSQTVSSLNLNSKPIRALICTSDAGTLTGSIYTWAAYSMGATDGTNSARASSTDQNGVDTTNSQRYNTISDIYGTVDSLGGTDNIATFTSFGTNQFTLNWTVANAARNLGWVVLADKT